MPLSGCSLPGCRLPLAAVVRGTCSMLVNNVLLMCSPQSHVECPEEMRQDLMSLPCVQPVWVQLGMFRKDEKTTALYSP